jgi:hypothetical protein
VSGLERLQMRLPLALLPVFSTVPVCQADTRVLLQVALSLLRAQVR